MTADQIEYAVALEFNRLDMFYDGDGSPQTQAEYDAAAAEIARWAEEQYALLALSELLPR